MCLSTSFLLLLCSRVASGLKTAMTVVCVERWVSASVGEYHWLQQEVPVNTSPVVVVLDRVGGCGGHSQATWLATMTAVWSRPPLRYPPALVWAQQCVSASLLSGGRQPSAHPPPSV